MFEKDDRTSITVQDDIINQPRATFAVSSPSDLLTPLAPPNESPIKSILKKIPPPDTTHHLKLQSLTHLTR